MSQTTSNNKHRRRSIRLKGYDYSQPGAYFVTICTHERESLFGLVDDDKVVLNEFGLIAQREWLNSAEIRQEVEMDEFVIMPDHLHGIVTITDQVGAHRRAHLRQDATSNRKPLQRQAKSLGSFIAGFKSSVTKQINHYRQMPGIPVWQRNYYEHIIRNERVLHAVREYIRQNPLRWHLDRYNVAALEPDPQAKVLWRMLNSS